METVPEAVKVSSSVNVAVGSYERVLVGYLVVLLVMVGVSRIVTDIGDSLGEGERDAVVVTQQATLLKARTTPPSSRLVIVLSSSSSQSISLAPPVTCEFEHC